MSRLPQCAVHPSVMRCLTPSGNVAPSSQVLDRYDEVIVLLSKGAYFGEVPALLNLRRMAKIMAVTWCELLRLNHVRTHTRATMSLVVPSRSSKLP